jgi:hypothetical protein
VMGVEQLWLPPSAWRSELSLSDDPLQALSADEKVQGGLPLNIVVCKTCSSQTLPIVPQGKLGHLQRQLQAEGLWNASLHGGSQLANLGGS